MNCADCEPRIAEWLDGQLAPEEAASVAAHVTECQHCHALAAGLRDLDSILARDLNPPAPSAQFEERLQARILAESPVELERKRAELKRQLQAEYEAQLERMRHGFRSVRCWLDVLGLGLLSAGALTAAVLQVPKLVQALPPDVQTRFGTPVVLGAALGTLVVMAAAWLVSRRPRRVASIL